MRVVISRGNRRQGITRQRPEARAFEFKRTCQEILAVKLRSCTHERFARKTGRKSQVRAKRRASTLNAPRVTYQYARRFGRSQRRCLEEGYPSRLVQK